MGKLRTLDEYLAEHEFLREAANFNLQLEQKFADVEPLDLPSRDEVLSIVNADKIPLLQRDEFSTKILDAVERLTNLPRELAETFLRQEPSDEVLMRKTFWAAVDKLVPDELKLWQRDEWTENFYPICGRRPVMAWLKKLAEGRARYLFCGGCRTLWHWRRVGCPYCGNVDLERIHIIEFDGKRTIRLDVCDECHAYLKTYGEDDEPNIYLRDWTTLHLDLLAEEQHLRKCGAVELE